MSLLVARAYFSLIRFEPFLVRGNFAGLYQAVRGKPCRPRGEEHFTTEKICYAIDLACIWYWKHVLCLQRSAAAVCLLRDYGIPAELVIGAQHIPFQAHAWVEVDGRVANDNSYMKEIYAVLDRC
jgi:hypothetical protein